MKYEYCEDCYFYDVEPGICDVCEDGDQFEPSEADDDAYDELNKLSAPVKRWNVISIRKIVQDEVDEEMDALEYLAKREHA